MCLKLPFERPGIDIVAVNDITDPATLAHLLKYDSTFGVYARNVEVKEGSLIVEDQEVKIFGGKKSRRTSLG